MIDKDLLMTVLSSMRVSTDENSCQVEIDYNGATCHLEFRDLELMSITVKRTE